MPFLNDKVADALLSIHICQSAQLQHMLNHETLYQLIYTQQWKQILTELYSSRKLIQGDIMLSHAGKIFEQAFFIDIRENTDKEVGEYLDTLYILHNANFYKLSEENYKRLILELVKRKPLREAANYAKSFPDEESCKAVIIQIAKENAEYDQNNNIYTIPMNWIEVFNRLFELINNQSDTATYFSGPKFINVIKETEPYFPDYNQYIEQRNREGKSTSRKIFFYDIMIGLSPASRNSVLIRILDLLRPFRQPQIEEIEQLLGLRTQQVDHPDNRAAESPGITKKENPKVFISYSWDNEDHKRWVLELANRMRSNGVDIILDRYYLTAGKSVTHFVENALRDAQKVVIIFTPNYKLKADQRAGGVGYEYSIINNSLYQNQKGNDKIIPVLRMGSMEESIPEFMQQYIHLDLRNGKTFENSYTDLLRDIYNEPAIKIPEIGDKPSFN